MQDADWSEQTPEQQFGARLRELREHYDLTQAALAKRLDDRGVKLDPSAIARLEKGLRSIRLNEAVTIASVMQMNVDELLRPALPPDEQVAQAKKQIDRTWWRSLAAAAEYDSAEERLRGLQKRLAEQGGDTDGERQQAT